MGRPLVYGQIYGPEVYTKGRPGYRNMGIRLQSLQIRAFATKSSTLEMGSRLPIPNITRVLQNLELTLVN